MDYHGSPVMALKQDIVYFNKLFFPRDEVLCLSNLREVETYCK